jgi:hypothetical protein
MRGLIWAAAAAALLTAAGPAGAAEIAEFKVTMKGVQKNTWEYKHTPQSACDVGLEGNGKETWSFWSSKPARIRAIRTRSGVFLVGRGGPARLFLQGRVRRDGTMSVTPGSVCSEGDGTGGPASEPPDCGTQDLASFVEPVFRKRSFLVIDDHVDRENGAGHNDPFRNCPARGTSWPDMLSIDDRHREIGQTLPAEDLFGHGKSIVIARGRYVSRASYGTSTTTIRWEVSFTRIDPR